LAEVETGKHGITGHDAEFEVKRGGSTQHVGEVTVNTALPRELHVYRDPNDPLTLLVAPIAADLPPNAARYLKAV
jgi:hypothetical protein